MIYNKQEIEQILKDAEMPLSIDAIRFRAKIKSWGTARAMLLDMLTDKRISGIKTSRGWIFWAKKHHGMELQV